MLANFEKSCKSAVKKETMKTTGQDEQVYLLSTMTIDRSSQLVNLQAQIEGTAFIYSMNKILE